MEEVLHQVILDNTVQSYLIVGVIIFFGFLFKRFIAHYVASFFAFLLKKRYKTLDPHTFKYLIAKPLGLFIAVLITVITLDRLNFPNLLDIKIYKISLKELLRMAASALIIITFFRFLIKSMDFVVLLIKERYMRSGDPGNHQLVFFFKDFIKVIIGVIGALLVLKYTFNYDIKGLVTGLSIVGAAIALALKESLENLIASFIIFFDKPFETGDAVKVNNFSGVVERIGLRSTRIRTDAKTYITVPNKQMVDSVLDNLSNRTQRRGDIRLEIGVDTAPAKVDELLAGIKTILTNPEIQNYNLYLTEITANALIVAGDYYTEPKDITKFNLIKQSINLEILLLMENLEIAASGKSTSVTIVKPAD
ncbi:mechanosensitive ion channel family protein [Niabella ginsengisoli]|uniref:Mechanosensitive ion channel n=1 Tax=Niabella ginsengisoli TaxID=522298 RepID=A0ABS9SNF1_9BACT|nr:mechanosensitive ion channel domain-containing protein [Niabella ginsengisoli]MCH5599892.1 mechanosensitive ion channel [Niabella ginsengisoli]